MNPRAGVRVVLLGFVAACAIITWNDLKQNGVAPPPASFVGAGMVYGGLGVMAELVPGLAGALAAGWTLGLLYFATGGTSGGTARSTAGRPASKPKVKAAGGGGGGAG